MKAKITSLLVVLALMGSGSDSQTQVQAVNVEQMVHLNIDAAKDEKQKKKVVKGKSEKKADPKAKSKSAPAPKKESVELTPEDEEAAATFASGFSGADESEVIENIYNHYAQEAKNAVGESTGEKIVFKEDALKAGAEAIESLKGLKGKKLETYMKKHFDESWAQTDINGEGEISLEEAHTFQRSLMGKLNQFSMAPGTVGDVSS